MFEDATLKLRQGKTVTLKPKGNSMTPIIKSGEEVTIKPVKGKLEKDDVVLAKVNGKIYLHKITTIEKERVQISNNHGHVNGWTKLHHIYGKADI